MIFCTAKSTKTYWKANIPPTYHEFLVVDFATPNYMPEYIFILVKLFI